MITTQVCMFLSFGLNPIFYILSGIYLSNFDVRYTAQQTQSYN